MEELHRTVRLLYTGRSKKAQWFRYGLIVFDTLSIIYFIAATALPSTTVTRLVNTLLGVLILLDLVLRLWISDNRRREMTRIYTVADVIVVASLLLAPIFSDNLGFLRVLRGLRVIHAYHLLRDLRRESPFFRRNEDVILAAVNLLVFVLVTTSLVFVIGFEKHAGVAGYVDALYFTVATLTTTGFGDITMTTPGGKLRPSSSWSSAWRFSSSLRAPSSGHPASGTSARSAGSPGMISTRSTANTAANP